MRIAARRISESVGYLAILGLGWVGYALDIPLPENGQPRIFAQDLFEWTKRDAHILIFLLAGIVGITRFVGWRLKLPTAEQLLIDRLVSECLDVFRTECFADIPEKTPRDHNRVTLFKHTTWLWRMKPWRCFLWPWGFFRGPASGWLCLFSRSGHATKSSRVSFLAPDDAQHAEGVAGMAWRSDGAARIRELPDLSGVTYVGNLSLFWLFLQKSIGRNLKKWDDYQESRNRVSKYAGGTSTTEHWVWQRIKAGKPSPICILAIPIESKTNERWGVLVLDSCNEIEPIDTEDRKFRTKFKNLTKALHRYEITSK